MNKITNMIKNTFKKIRSFINAIYAKILQSRLIKIIIIVFISLSIIFSIFVLRIIRKSKDIEIKYETVEFEDLPKSFNDFKVCIISDVHIGLYIKQNSLDKIIDIVRKEKPDIICVIGDHIYSLPHKFNYHNKKNVLMLSNFFCTLTKDYTVYSVRGNHDNWEARDEVEAATINGGAIALDNKGVWLTNKIKKDERIRISGVGDLHTDKVEIDLAVGNAKTNDFMIMLSHNPKVISDVIEKQKDNYIDFMLSGHTHAGQINIIKTKEEMNNTRFGKAHYYGLKEYGKTKLFVTSGVGMVLLPIRYNAKAEIVFVTFKRKIEDIKTE